MPPAPLAERLTAQALAGEPLRSPEAVAERLLVVQGQEVARWGLAGGKVTIEHLSEVRKKDAAALEEEAVAVKHFLSS